MIRYVFILGSLLIIKFLMGNIYEPIEQNYYLSNVIVLGIIACTILAYFRKLKVIASFKYWTLVRKGLAVGIAGGIVAVLFFAIFTAVYPGYVEDLIAVRATELHTLGYNVIEIKSAMDDMRRVQRLHAPEVVMVFSCAVRTFAVALIIAGLIVEKPVAVTTP
jgi:hypothetical protein